MVLGSLTIINVIIMIFSFTKLVTFDDSGVISVKMPWSTVFDLIVFSFLLDI